MTPAGTSAQVRVRVPAKVNLFLAVRGRRPDGYHEITSVMHTVGLYDEVAASLEGGRVACYHPSSRRYLEVELRHDAGDAIPSGDENLAVRAATELAAAVGGRRDRTDRADVPERPLTRLALRKRIPVGAGMAGGSADAAGALVALNRLWDCDLDLDELREIGARLGADVPFCVGGGTALATGTGTATAQVLCRGTFHWVIGISDRPLATADVYRTWDELAEPSEVEPDAVLHALRTEDPEALGAALHNDLEAATFHLRPDLRDARDALLDAGALGAVVSGSGPTVVGLSADESTARHVAAQVSRHFHRVEVARSPAGGPELLEER